MKCPNCDFVVATKKDICPKCDLDLRPFKKEQGIKISDPSSSVEVLRRREKHAQSQSDQLNVLKRETMLGRGPSVDPLLPSEFSEKSNIARMRILSALRQTISTPQRQHKTVAAAAISEPPTVAVIPIAPPHYSEAVEPPGTSLPISLSGVDSFHAEETPASVVHEDHPIAADIFTELQTPPTIPPPPEEATPTGRILSTEKIETFSKVLDELSASLQANIEKAKNATHSISEKDFAPEDALEEAPQAVHSQIATHNATELQTVAQVISFLQLKQKAELHKELQLLEAALYELETGQASKSVANSGSTANKASSYATVVTSSTSRDATLIIDNTSLLDALREYDQATGFDSALESLDSEEEFEAEAEKQGALHDQDILEEPEFPSTTARLGVFVIDTIAILGISALASLVFIPTPIAKLMFLELQPHNLQALPHIATYLYALLATLLTYNTVLATAGMQTIGGKIFAVEVLNNERFELSFPRAFLRTLCMLVTVLTCGLGYLPALAKRRTLHEVLSQTFTQMLTPIVLTDHEVFKKKVYDIEEV
jgi:uncharacterized RDD family membrane protein YckC